MTIFSENVLNVYIIEATIRRQPQVVNEIMSGAYINNDCNLIAKNAKISYYYVTLCRKFKNVSEISLMRVYKKR